MRSEERRPSARIMVVVRIRHRPCRQWFHLFPLCFPPQHHVAAIYLSPKLAICLPAISQHCRSDWLPDRQFVLLFFIVSVWSLGVILSHRFADWLMDRRILSFIESFSQHRTTPINQPFNSVQLISYQYSYRPLVHSYKYNCSYHGTQRRHIHQ